jgi:hypothetical protein
MHQEVQPLFELFFIAVLLTSLLLAFGVMAAIFRGRWPAAWRRAQPLLLLDSGYLALVFSVSLLAPPRVLRPGDLECFDDWCITVQSADCRPPHAVLVRFKVVSQARRAYQSEKLAHVEIRDDRGAWHATSIEAQQCLNATLGAQPALTQRLGPGESFSTALAFDLPASTRRIALRINHGNGPGPFIIGESHLFRPGPEFHLQLAPSAEGCGI